MPDVAKGRSKELPLRGAAENMNGKFGSIVKESWDETKERANDNGVTR
jgi:hypothetical protein